MDQARWSVWDLPAALVPMNYVEAVQRAGGLAVLRPSGPRAHRGAGPAARPPRRPHADRRPGRRRGPLRRRAPRPRRARGPPARRGRDRPRARGPRAAGCPCWASAAGCSSSTWRPAAPCASTCPTSSATSATAASLGSFPGNEHRVDLERGLAGAGERRREPARRRTRTTIRPSRDSATGLRVTGRAEEDEVPEAIEGDGPGLGARRAVAPRGRSGQPRHRRPGGRRAGPSRWAAGGRGPERRGRLSDPRRSPRRTELTW